MDEFMPVLLPWLLFVAASGFAQDAGDVPASREGSISVGPPTELRMSLAGHTTIDVRNLSTARPRRRSRPRGEEPAVQPVALPGGIAQIAAPPETEASTAAPPTLSNFLGLDFATWGSGRPPNPVGDVGPTYYIQAVNTSIGIYRKSDSARVAAFTFDTFMSQGNFGNLCDTDNAGNPVVLYDSFEDRWVITDFAFQLNISASSNVISPPSAYECFAVSRTGDPVAGGWNFYSLQLTDALNGDPKLGIWPDGIYMSANMIAAGGTLLGTRVWALNKAQMYAGEPTTQVVSLNPPTGEFSLLPANARLQAGTPPPGSPNYFSVVWQFANALSIYKFHVDWTRTSLSTFTGPFLAVTPDSWLNPPLTVRVPGGNNNRTVVARLMMQNQYTNLAGLESLWNTHTIGHPTAKGVAAVRYYQTTVTGGTVAGTAAQAATYAPDTSSRYIPSLAVDHAGNMSLGYTASSETLFPAIRYVGRLSTDPVNTLPQTEASLVEGTGSQNTSTLWGTYSAMTLDPDGCTFWYTNEYYITTGDDWQTRIGSFAYPTCTPFASGTVEGMVTATSDGAPISGATIGLGSRTTTTNGAGFYQFLNIPSGTYPTLSASAPGFDSVSFTSLVVTDGATTTQDFSLGSAPTSACLLETSQADFQTGVPTNVDLTRSPGNVLLQDGASLDQQNTLLGSSAFGITSTVWGGQTFTAGVTGQLTRVDLNLFCFNCNGTFPNLTLSVRATKSNLPTGADIASTTIPGFNSAFGRFFTATFSSPPILTAGSVYALVIHPVADPTLGIYALTQSLANVYARGQAVRSVNNGATWSAPLTPPITGQTTDAGFKTYIKTGFVGSGDFVSSVKDSNPAVGLSTAWSALSWTGVTPANTNLQFQVGASNSAAGPFSFVGPDGTAVTFYTASGASLSQFSGQRYLKYKAYLSTTDNTVTPTLQAVTVCY